MSYSVKLAILLISSAAVLRTDAHQHQYPLAIPQQEQVDISTEPWTTRYGAQQDLGYTGPLSFSHFPYTRCLEDPSQLFDIAIIGFPFDTTTSYRPGAYTSEP